MPWKEVVPPPQKEIDEFVTLFKKKARFLVDESLGPEVANMIKNQGWNVKYVDEIGLKGHDDHDVFSFAWRDDRILLTHDRDFLDDRAFPLYRNPGVIVLPGGAGDEQALTNAMMFVFTMVAPFREVHRKVKVAVDSDGNWTTIGRNPETGAIDRRKMRIRKNGPLEEWQDE